MVGKIVTNSPLILSCTYENQSHQHEAGFIKPIDQTLKVGDICLFYGQYSIVEKIQNPQDPYDKQVAEISTEIVVSEDDVKFMKKAKAGELSWMRHGFSLKQLVKVVPIGGTGMINLSDFNDCEIYENRTRKECTAIKNHDYKGCKCWTSDEVQPECRSLTPRLVRGKLVIIEKQVILETSI